MPGASPEIFRNVSIGEGAQIHPSVILGLPPRGRAPGELPLIIGKRAVLRPYTVIYAGTTIGDDFQTGQGASIREDNRLGDQVSVGTHTVLEFSNTIGNRVRIHSHAFLEMVTVADDVFIGPHVVFTDDPHPMGCPRYKECLGGPRVGELARIGANCTVLPGVVIGRNTLVGAGSVVVDDVEDETVVAGNPARRIKSIHELECFPGFYDKPYVWPPYTADPGTRRGE